MKQCARGGGGGGGVGGGGLSWTQRRTHRDDKQKDHLDGPWWMVIEPPKVAVGSAADNDAALKAVADAESGPMEITAAAVPVAPAALAAPTAAATAAAAVAPATPSLGLSAIPPEESQEDVENKQMTVLLAIEPVQADEEEEAGELSNLED